MRKGYIFFAVIFAYVLFAIQTSQSSALVCPPTDCSAQIQTCENELIVCNNTQNDTLTTLEEYRNLSDYYKTLYEDQEVNVTNRELIILHQQIYNLNMTVNDVKEELSFLKLTIKVSVPIISFTLISLFGATFYLRRKLKEKDGE